MVIFGDPMGYLLTFGKIFDDDQKLYSNHNHPLEMTFRRQNQCLDLVIDWLETQNGLNWRPHGVFIDLWHGFR